jgi:hypothetical protein
MRYVRSLCPEIQYLSVINICNCICKFVLERWMMRYQFSNEVSDSIVERPFSKAFAWFVLLLIVLFFFGFYSIILNTNYIPQSALIEAGETTQSVVDFSPLPK